MSKHIIFVITFFLSISIFFTSCEDTSTSDPLVGSWDYTERIINSCVNSTDNNIVNYSGNGDCETMDNVTTCSKYSLVMNSGNYSINKEVTFGVDEISTVEEEGTYKFQEGIGFNVIFCTDILCRTTNYSIVNNELSLESEDTNTGCVTIITAEKR